MVQAWLRPSSTTTTPTTTTPTTAEITIATTDELKNITSISSKPKVLRGTVQVQVRLEIKMKSLNLL
ncbi:hypothetical protein [Histophilus somni]|uniref:hypothetical protein n=1 Tax=Histophilus somni TaxID=731 RepID=UPI0018ECFF65|nr:hypothetical protein [Histophilus somni]QQF78455.1 hypothetical protein JFL53_08015 [Histophilus somni]